MMTNEEHEKIFGKSTGDKISEILTIAVLGALAVTRLFALLGYTRDRNDVSDQSYEARQERIDELIDTRGSGHYRY